MQLIDQAVQKIEELRSILMRLEAERKPKKPTGVSIMSMLRSDEWPDAIHPDMICNHNLREDREARASGIVDMFLHSPADKRILDFGCGDGYVARAVSQGDPVISVGYDIKQQGDLEWNRRKNGLLLTTDFRGVEQEKPFDTILLYDVLDHATDPVGVLQQAHSVLSPTGTIIVRAHPFCGRHGGHVYNFINKAFAHLILVPDELAKLGVVLDDTQRVTSPEVYNQWISQAGLAFMSHAPQVQTPEPFFDNPSIRKRLDRHRIKPESLPMCFMDFVLIDSSRTS